MLEFVGKRGACWENKKKNRTFNCGGRVLRRSTHSKLKRRSFLAAVQVAGVFSILFLLLLLYHSATGIIPLMWHDVVSHSPFIIRKSPKNSKMRPSFLYFFYCVTKQNHQILLLIVDTVFPCMKYCTLPKHHRIMCFRAGVG